MSGATAPKQRETAASAPTGCAKRVEASGPEAYTEMLRAALSPDAGQRPQRRERKADR